MIMNLIGRILGPDKRNGDGGAVTIHARTPSIGAYSSVSPLVDSDEALTAEIGRARRYEHALSIAVVSPMPSSDGHNGQRVLPHVTASGLREILRETDILCYRPDDDCFVLGLTESEREAARRALNRVQSLFRTQLDLDLVVGVAQFPEDGFTFGDLVERARADAESARASGTEASERAEESEPTRANGVHRPAARRLRVHAMRSSKSERLTSGPLRGE